MAYQYADLDELIKDLLPGSAGKAAEKESLGRVLEGVSNFIDKFCRRPEKYFMPAGEQATTRPIRGEGRRFLRLPEHVRGATIVGLNAGLYYEHEASGWIYASENVNESVALSSPFYNHYRSGAFADGAVFPVSARWGFEETPAAIREAARQTTLRVWETQRGIFGNLSPSGIVIERDLPPFVETLLLEFRRRQFEI